jgi:hypothetical protein
LRLIVDGFNDRKHTTAYREETFGFPGARVDGKPTIGNILGVPLPPSVQRSLQGWPALSDRVSLRQWLQDVIGPKRAFIEEAKGVQNQEGALVEVKLRLPVDESDRDIENILAPAAESWLRQQVAGLGGGDRSAS